MGSFDKQRRPGIVVKSFSQLTDSNFEHGFADKSFRPDNVEKFLFSDELARTSNEVAEHGETDRPEKRVTARSKLPQKKWTGLHLPQKRERNSLNTRSLWTRTRQNRLAYSRS